MLTYVPVEDVEKHNTGVTDNITQEHTYYLVLLTMDGGPLGAYASLFLCRVNRDGLNKTVIFSSESAETWGDVFLGSKESNEKKLKDLMACQVNSIVKRFELAKSRPIIDLTQLNPKIHWH